MDGRTLERRYDEVLREAQYLRDHCHHLELELGACRPALYRADQRIDRLEQRVGKLSAENKILKRKLADLTAKMKAKPRPAPPMFVKPDAISKTRRTPGRKKGHPAALRPMPSIIDVHETVALPIDALGKPCCPECRSQLSDVEAHERYVEELIPSKVVTTCYHTTSGWCPCCRKKVESRAENQPPAADLPHAQLGLNALSTAMVMRVCYRLPFRQITRLFLDLPGLKISPGAIVKQIKRTGKWMEKQYHRLKLVIRAAGVVHADETGWRTNGRNGYLWTLSTAGHTLFHVDRSRSAKVIAELLGKAFGGRGDQTLVSDFYSVYDQFDGPQQKCLTHLLRELRDTVVKRPELTGHAFFVRCKRLIQDMLRLKKRRGKLKAADYWRRVEGVERRLQDLVQRQWNDPDADRLSGRLNKYQAKLTTFLHKKEVDGTNNAAERALRPAVVMRKITGGSRSEEGARAWAIVASVMRTAEQQGKDVLKSIKTLMRAEWAGKESTLLTELLPFDSS
jgi:transposase/polyhydroxyalkanoate synthesis regulator phasin